jgi:hypothetical protein
MEGKRKYYGEINGEERYYYVYTKGEVTAFFYTKLGYGIFMLYNHKEIKINTPNTWHDDTSKIGDIIFKYLIELLNDGYNGKTELIHQVIRNQSVNKFNPIKEIEFDGSTHIVEWHSRAKKFSIRRAKKYDERKYTTRIWQQIGYDEYKYLGEMA